MNVISTLKKIFNSYDFRGNRIKNLRVDTPIEKIEYRESAKNTPNPDTGYFGPKGENGPGGVQHFVANKKYVDQKTTLNTDKTWRFEHPFFIWWMQEKEIKGKTYKEVFDELFFPKIEHQFISPEITNVDIFVKENPLIDTLEIDNNFRKFVIYNYCDNIFEVKIRLNRNDWISSVVGNLIIEYTNDNKKIFNSTTTSNTELIFKFTLNWNPITIKRIYFKRVYDSYDLKTNTYGELSVPKETPLTFEQDITEYFKKICYPFSLRVVTDSGLTYVNNIFIPAENPKIINFRVDINLVKKYCFKAYIFNEDKKLINIINIYHKDFYQLDNGDCEYDFGYYPFNIDIKLVPFAIRLL